MVKLVVRAPCCSSRRTCLDTNKYVINIAERNIIAEIPATRCYRGIEQLYEIEIAEEKVNDIAIVEHYISNRGVHYLTIEYPETPTPDIVDTVKEVLGLREMRKIIVK